MTNIYTLLVCLTFLFFLSYVFCGKDFFSPSTMLSLTFMFSTMCAIYKYPVWRYDFSGWTTFIITSSLAITLVINYLVVMFDPKYLIKKRLAYSENITPITIPMTIVAIIIILITALALVKHIVRVGGIGGTIQSIMASYRSNGSYSTDLDNQMPQWIKILQYFTNAFSYLFAFDLIFFWNELKAGRRIGDILIIALCVIIGLLSGGRFGMASLLITIFLMNHLIAIKKRGYYKQYKLSSIIKITLAVLLAFFIFYIVRTLVGRDDDQGLFDYIGHYFGGGVPLLDIYLKKDRVKPLVWGQETFYSLINNFSRLGLVNVSYYFRHHEFVYRYGNSLGNVYTAFRDYYHDFGLVGMYILHILFSWIYCVQYQRMKKYGNILKIIVFSTTYYAVVFYPFNNALFATIFSMGFMIQLAILIVLYEIMLRKKVGFKRYE